MRGFDIFLVLIAIPAVIGFAEPTLGVGLAFTGIGIPLALLIWIAPAAAFLLVPPRIVQHIIGGIPGIPASAKGYPGYLIAFATCIVLNLAVAYANLAVTRPEMGRLVTGDQPLAELAESREFSLMSAVSVAPTVRIFVSVCC